MKFYDRAICGACITASDQFQVLLLTGPRQIGKTTLLQRLTDKDRRYPKSRLIAFGRRSISIC